MSTEGEVMDASGAPVTDELTGVHRGPRRDAIYEPEKTARRKAHDAAGRLQRLNTSRTSAQLYQTQQDDHCAASVRRKQRQFAQF